MELLQPDSPLLAACLSSDRPYLSVVAASRNDDHGGDPLRRTTIFINSLAWQAEKYRLETELVLVEWNPPRDRPGLAETLSFPAHEFFCARIITVPSELHAGFRHGDRLPLFQMIGKNVGIRRARGEFILASNIDILLDDALFAALASRRLDPKRMYRADRYDVLNRLPETGHDERQAFCRETGNQIRRNHRITPPYFGEMQEKDPTASAIFAKTNEILPEFEFSGDAYPVCRLGADAPVDFLHTNACGDFTLMHREAWAALRGYGEFETFSMHIDSIGCIQAHLAGWRESAFLPPLVCYHIEHAPASGWTPEAGNILFARLVRAGIPFLEWELLRDMLVKRLQANPDLMLNGENWGLAGFELEETIFRPGEKKHVGFMPPKPDFRPLAALAPLCEPSVIYQDFFQSQHSGAAPPNPSYYAFKNICRRLMKSKWRKIGLFFNLTSKYPGWHKYFEED